ncbi:MAG: Glycosyl transferase family 2 [Candidatus Amesbacteria bacterium GW2011_GWB1_47_19]|nr:MAG: Glycosyl transferase family 2 [Candidatus Amesbacteria bacterium GW2011_GWA1_44_24]KKU66940.1 MAG: Glycosyl transferase family 2 [Candidatus Amesbacteria bacterium GW2011_GWB1_47_19]
MVVNRPVISVIIVSWNVRESVSRCLDSVFAAAYPRLEVIVVDNASTDGSVQMIKDKFKNVKLISNTENSGFPKAVNRGIFAAVGDYYLVLNPDTRIPRHFFDFVLEYARTNPDLGVLGPRFKNPDGSLQGSVFPEPSVSDTIREYWFGQQGLTAKFTPDSDSPVTVNAVSGGCMFIPKSTFTRIGTFTESVFMYYEDLDYCRRIRNSGLQVIFHPGISIIHEHGMSSGKSSQGKYRNFIESIIYPFRKLLKLPNRIQSFQRYQTESGVWYNGWLKHTLIAGIIWTSRKWPAIFHRKVQN